MLHFQLIQHSIEKFKQNQKMGSRIFSGTGFIGWKQGLHCFHLCEPPMNHHTNEALRQD